MRESEVEEYFRKRVKLAGGEQRKFVSPGRRGVVDRIVGFHYAKFAFIELKAPGKVAEDHQLREHKKWRDMGFMVFVIDSKEDVDRFIGAMFL